MPSNLQRIQAEVRRAHAEAPGQIITVYVHPADLPRIIPGGSPAARVATLARLLGVTVIPRPETRQGQVTIQGATP